VWQDIGTLARGTTDTAMKKTKSASELGDWRGKQADPDVVEEWKGRGVPVWSTGEAYKGEKIDEDAK
jgi:hypothetical protein